jgi:Family of unknown function (DUF6879)
MGWQSPAISLTGRRRQGKCGVSAAISGKPPIQEDDVALDFVGMSDTSPHGSCPAVYRDPATGDGVFVGKRVTDPLLLAEVASHGSIDADEGVFRMPANMWPHILKAASGDYEPDLRGHGPLSIEDIIKVARFSVAHLEMRDDYGLTDPAFLHWKETGRHPDDDPRDEAWREVIRDRVARGVGFRRLRVVSEPASEYIRWEWEITSQINVAAGEDVRWLPRSKAVGLMLPAHDLWMYDHHVVRFLHFQPDGELSGEASTNDPATVAAVTAAFETAWDHATPHADFRPE